MTASATLAGILGEILRKHCESTASPADIEALLETPKESSHGDLAFPCFQLAKAMKKSPPQIAAQLLPLLQTELANSPVIQRVEVVGAYLNFFLHTPFLAGIIPHILEGRALDSLPASGERVMIEYSQPNTHKAFHVGHMRNVALGDALVRMYRHCGHDVVAANYIGDEGTHIAKCLWAYLRHREAPVPEHFRGEYLGNLYRKADEMLDFKTLSRYPYPGLLTARIDDKQPHPSRKEWQVVTLYDGRGPQQVVCGGSGYKVGDIVTYAPLGSKVGGRLVEAKEMEGVPSRGVILSEKELDVGEDKNKIHILADQPAPGLDLCEVGRMAGALPADTRVEQEIRRRNGEISEILHQLEDKSSDLQALFRETKEWSMHDFREVYNWIDCHFDHYFFESEVGQDGKDMVLQAHKQGILIESEGAIGADLKNHKLGFLMLLKSDGTGLYATKDIALAKRKFEEFRIDRSIYVVDFSQSLHFSQVFKTLELLGFAQAKKCYHLAYGLVTLPEGKMSTRKGTVIYFSELRRQLMEHIRAEFLDKHKETWSEDEMANAARLIAIATIKYGMLNQDNLKNIIFDMNEWTSLTGNTGPYLLYAYARTCSIEREVGTPSPQAKLELLNDPHEREVMVLLNQFPNLVMRATAANRPQSLCIYLYDLAKGFSRMYEHCPVKKAETDDLRQARMALVRATGLTLQKGLNLIGISTLERM